MCGLAVPVSGLNAGLLFILMRVFGTSNGTSVRSVLVRLIGWRGCPGRLLTKFAGVLRTFPFLARMAPIKVGR